MKVFQGIFLNPRIQFGKKFFFFVLVGLIFAVYLKEVITKTHLHLLCKYINVVFMTSILTSHSPAVHLPT